MTDKNMPPVGKVETTIEGDILTAGEIELLTPKEIEVERQAKLEELKKRSWMASSATELAGRIPVSVFAMGSLLTAR